MCSAPSSQFRVKSKVAVGHLGHGHIGDIDVKAGQLFAALEDGLGILVMPTAVFDAPHAPENKPLVYSLVEANGSAPPQSHAPWCAYDPVGKILYSSSDDRVSKVYGYRMDTANCRFIHDASADRSLQGKPLNHVQGGAITPNGRLIMSSDGPPAIHVYDLSDGRYWGAAGVNRSGGWPKYEEVEGVDVRLGVKNDGHETQIHLVLLDNDWPDQDDVIIKHYSVPDPSNL
jgi:hypothetical protein